MSVMNATKERQNPTPESLSDEIIALADLLATAPVETKKINIRSWQHLAVYAPELISAVAALNFKRGARAYAEVIRESGIVSDAQDLPDFPLYPGETNNKEK